MANADQRAKEKSRRLERQRFLELASEADPQRCAYGHAGLGDPAFSEGEPEAAVRHLRQALELAPLEPHFHYLLGFTYGQMERWRASEGGGVYTEGPKAPARFGRVSPLPGLGAV